MLPPDEQQRADGRVAMAFAAYAARRPEATLRLVELPAVVIGTSRLSGIIPTRG